MRFAACALTAALLAWSGASGAVVVWDQGPSTGVSTGGWVNQSASQNFADSVHFGTDTAVNGLNYYSVFDLADHAGSADFKLKILADDGGSPGAYLLTQDLGYDSISQVAPDLYELTFSFADFNFLAGVTYWVGLSGNGFEAAQAGVAAPQDGVMAQFDGSTFFYLTETDVGDQMFQLTATSAVPEPSSLLLLSGGLALLAARRRRS